MLEGPTVVTVKNGQLKRQKERELAFNQVVECSYVEPWRTDKPGGKTSKFPCDYTYRTDNGRTKTKKLKIKYDDGSAKSINTSVYAEAIATRLLWSIGYYADIIIPVQVRCAGCPNDPWKHITSYWSAIENERRLVSLAPGAPDFVKFEKFLVGDSVRFIAETLSRHEAYKAVQVSGRDYDYKIIDPSGNEVFSTASGILRLSGQDIPVWDPTMKRLLTVELSGVTDFKINHLDPAVFGGRLAGARDYVAAVVEWKHNSIPIETYYHEGWSFNSSPYEPERSSEIRLVEPASPALTLARQELVLLSVFIGHADNKAEQQRIICLDPDKIEAEDNDCNETGDPREKACAAASDVKLETCDAPALMLQDLGLSMGYGTRTLGTDANGKVIPDSSPAARSYGSADPKGFLDAPIFKDEVNCITTVNEWVTGVEIEERITDEARRTLVDKLRRLAENDQDLTELFRVGRLHLKKLRTEGKPLPPLAAPAPGTSSFAGGETEAALVAEFKTAFKAKVERLAGLRCPQN
jgi:hypothetical protein